MGVQVLRCFLQKAISFETLQLPLLLKALRHPQQCRALQSEKSCDVSLKRCMPTRFPYSVMLQLPVCHLLRLISEGRSYFESCLREILWARLFWTLPGCCATGPVQRSALLHRGRSIECFWIYTKGHIPWWESINILHNLTIFCIFVSEYIALLSSAAKTELSFFTNFGIPH